MVILYAVIVIRNFATRRSGFTVYVKAPNKVVSKQVVLDCAAYDEWHLHITYSGGTKYSYVLPPMVAYHYYKRNMKCWLVNPHGPEAGRCVTELSPRRK